MNDLELTEQLAGEIALSDFGPRLAVVNWDTLCAGQLLTGKGFKIKQSRSFDNKFNKFVDGIHSVKFGTTWEDEDAFKGRYSCECGYRTGGVYEDEICPQCGKPVGFVDVDLDVTGWICMNNTYKIINPAIFPLLQKYFGKTALDHMLKFDKEIDADGHYPPNKSSGKDQYVSIGLTGFYDRFIEILEFYRPSRKKKEKYYWEIIKKYDCIFASAIPVYSSVLRPIFTSPSEYHYTKTETAFNVITGCVNKLNMYREHVNECNIAPINRLLYTIQEKTCLVDELTFKMLDKKTGHIHDGIFGGRLNFSARDVIVPDPTLRADQIKLSYVAVLEMYKLEIINLITKIHGCSYSAALKYWFDAHIRFSKFVYQIMLHMMTESKYGMVCLINRNPEPSGRKGVILWKHSLIAGIGLEPQLPSYIQ